MKITNLQYSLILDFVGHWNYCLLFKVIFFFLTVYGKKNPKKKRQEEDAPIKHYSPIKEFEDAPIKKYSPKKEIGLHCRGCGQFSAEPSMHGVFNITEGSA